MRPSWDEVWSVVVAARNLDAAYAVVGQVVVGIDNTTNSKQWGEFHQAAQELHLALDHLPKPHVHGGWSVTGMARTANESTLILTCATCPVEVEVPNKLPIEVPE
jgi:hypothetical protein